MPGYAKKYAKPDHLLKRKRGGGRTAWEPTKEQLSTIESMAAIGMTYEDIAKVLKKDVETVNRACGELMDQARLKANGRVAGNLFKQTETSVRACEFWLTNREPSRWQDRRNVVMSGKLTVEERPDLSRLSSDDLDVLRQAAVIMARAQAPMIEHDATPTEQPDDDE